MSFYGYCFDIDGEPGGEFPEIEDAILSAAMDVDGEICKPPVYISLLHESEDSETGRLISSTEKYIWSLDLSAYVADMDPA